MSGEPNPTRTIKPFVPQRKISVRTLLPAMAGTEPNVCLEFKSAAIKLDPAPANKRLLAGSGTRARMIPAGFV